MRKQIKKKLYTYYTVLGDLDEIRNNPAHKFVSYSGGKAECIKYHDSFTSWISEIIDNNFKNGFGIKLLTDDEEHKVLSHICDYECTTFVCSNWPEDYIGKILGNIITYYFSRFLYYDIEEDHIYMRREFTGHTYYKSPYESCDICGTCDGAKCSMCKTIYTVVNLSTEEIFYEGFDEKEAKRVEKELKIDYSNIISDILSNYNINMEWFEKEINGASDDKALFKILNEYKIPYCIH